MLNLYQKKPTWWVNKAGSETPAHLRSDSVKEIWALQPE